MKAYSEFRDTYFNRFSLYKLEDGYATLARVIIGIGIILSFYFSLASFSIAILVVLIVLIGSFLAIFKIHEKIKYKRKLYDKLVQINENELTFLQGDATVFNGGEEFKSDDHPFTNDLDIFGKHSLFQYLNRTGSSIGKQQLAHSLSAVEPRENIVETQEAVNELSGKIEFRQFLQAYGLLNEDKPKDRQTIQDWIDKDANRLPSFIRIISYVLPAVIFLLLVGMFFDKDLAQNILWKVVTLNLVVLFTQYNRIKSAIIQTDKIHEIIRNYGRLIVHIEKENFESDLLKEYQAKLAEQGRSAGEAILEYSKLINAIASILNIFGLILFNGFLLYHLHVLNRLHKWKDKHGASVADWLSIIGYVEELSSLANLKYNNPDFAFPEIHQIGSVEMNNAIHPLIKTESVVENDVNLADQRFIILTGSNMSGKSTYLRTIGVNMILTNIGAPVCADSASISPMKVFCSMRLSDSLADSESFFYTELKKIKQIIEAVEDERSLVLLDEILRGTNSDDKRKGTLEVIKKMVQYKGIGVIATHDLEVCHITEEYPDMLWNACFESEIVNDELIFDYKLKDGVCRNKNATFLMEKMKII